MSESTPPRCNLNECQLATTGQCLEGLDPPSCPHYLAESQTESVDANDKLEIPLVEEQNTISLPDGLDLNAVTATRLTRAKLTRVIVIAGDQDAGKTTLVSSIYERFHRGSFAGFLFAGSCTLPGFERRCFPSRVQSDRLRADTVRTSRGDGELFLHLCLRKADLSEPEQDILFSDISGEFFRDACDSTEGCHKLKVLSRADHIALCIDGKKLLDVTQRHSAVNAARLLLRSAIDSRMIGPNTFVDVLFTKFDLFMNEPNSADLLKFVQSVKSHFINQFEQQLRRLRFFEVAARPEFGELPLGYGLDQILPSWVEETPLIDMKNPESAGLPKAHTEFDGYFFRRIRSLDPYDIIKSA